MSAEAHTSRRLAEGRRSDLAPPLHRNSLRGRVGQGLPMWLRQTLWLALLVVVTGCAELAPLLEPPQYGIRSGYYDPPSPYYGSGWPCPPPAPPPVWRPRPPASPPPPTPTTPTQAFALLKRQLERLGIRVRYFAADDCKGLYGIYYHPNDIRICPRDPAGEFATLAHEAAHAWARRLLSNGAGVSKSIHELVAETVAARTMAALGFGRDTDPCGPACRAGVSPADVWRFLPLIDAVGERVLEMTRT